MKARGIERPTFKGAGAARPHRLPRAGNCRAAGRAAVRAARPRPKSGASSSREKRCIQCHSVGGVGRQGGAGPRARCGAAAEPHASSPRRCGTRRPAMLAAMKPRGITVPQLRPEEMADIVAYLYSVRYFGNAGRPAQRVRGAVAARGVSTATASPGSAARPRATSRAPRDWTRRRRCSRRCGTTPFVDARPSRARRSAGPSFASAGDGGSRGVPAVARPDEVTMSPAVLAVRAGACSSRLAVWRVARRQPSRRSPTAASPATSRPATSASPPRLKTSPRTSTRPRDSAASPATAATPRRRAWRRWTRRRASSASPTRQQIPQVCGRCHSDARLHEALQPVAARRPGGRVRDLGPRPAAQGAGRSEGRDVHELPPRPLHPAAVGSEVERPSAPGGRDVRHAATPMRSTWPNTRSRPISFRSTRRASTGRRCRRRATSRPPRATSATATTAPRRPGSTGWATSAGSATRVMAELFTKSVHAKAFAADGQRPAARPATRTTGSRRPATTCSGSGDKAVCASCHSADDKGGKSAAEMRALIDSLSDRIREGPARSCSRPSTRAWRSARLSSISTAPRTPSSRPARAVHAFTVDAVKKEVDAGLAISAKAYARGVRALEELRVPPERARRVAGDHPGAHRRPRAEDPPDRAPARLRAARPGQRRRSDGRARAGARADPPGLHQLVPRHQRRRVPARRSSIRWAATSVPPTVGRVHGRDGHAADQARRREAEHRADLQVRQPARRSWSGRRPASCGPSRPSAPTSTAPCSTGPTSARSGAPATTGTTTSTARTSRARRPGRWTRYVVNVRGDQIVVSKSA